LVVLMINAIVLLVVRCCCINDQSNIFVSCSRAWCIVLMINAMLLLVVLFVRSFLSIELIINAMLLLVVYLINQTFFVGCSLAL